MHPTSRNWAIAVTVSVALSGAAASAQAPSVPSQQTETSSGAGAAERAGGVLRGVVKSGTTPLPGVTVTAQNTLTGKRYSTVTDVAGVWSMAIPVNGRYVVRTQFAAFAPGALEALLNATNHQQTLNFDLMLASRAAAQQQAEEQQSAQATRIIQQLAGNGAQSLNLLNALAGNSDQQTGIA